MMTDCHIPYLSEDEKLFLNTAATYSQARRMSSQEQSRPSIEDNHHHRRHQVVSSHSLSFLWKRRGSSASSSTHSSSGSIDYSLEPEHSAKAKELEILIFDQPQRTVRLSLTPRCAV